jgi:SAM-dependent methyltransferase
MHADTYAMGRTAEEEQRLQRQSVLYAPPTRQLFEAAGIGPGMKVLDLGSGAGDVAMLVAELVGPTGSVVGVDLNPTIIETAHRRAQAAGYANVTFVAGDMREAPLDDDFDAVVGRLILCHLPDPAAYLRQVLPHLRSGGVAAFYDLDKTSDAASYPPSGIHQRALGWIRQALTYGGVEIATGTKMHEIFLASGLPAPLIRVDALMGGSHAFVEAFTSYGAETVRTLLPLLIKGGIATAQEVEIATLAARWRDEVHEQGSVVRSYLFMGAWAHKV